MSEWLDLMLEEVRRKERETQEARDEDDRRKQDAAQPTRKPADVPNQSK